MKSHLLRSLVCMFLLISSAALWAQTTGQITGTVRDNTGAVVNGAKITITDAGKGVSRETASNSAGEYLVSGLGAATYDLNVTSPGFKTFQARGVVLQVGQKARVDVDLQVGAVSTEVVVQGSQVAQVETQSSDLSGVVNGKEITQLQLNGRNFTQLVTLVPGVSNQTGQDEGTVGVYGNVSFSMNGGRVEYNNWELDGGDNMDNGSNSTLNVYPSLDAIAEFRVLTSNYGAQYGRNGSGTVEVETKSGTNTFHGDVYEFNRNDKFNARNYFNRPPDSKAGYKKNDYGYTIGGPIYIPGVYNTDKQKTFFFWSQEWRKESVPGQTFNLAVPSVANRNGNFSDLCPGVDCPVHPLSINGVTDPLAGQPFAGNQVPFNPNDPNVQALLLMIPSPNAVGPDGVTPFFNSSPSQPTNWREELVRIDHNISSKHRATFRYIHDSWDTITATPLWTNAGSFPTIGTNFKGPGVSIVARLTSTFTPTLLNEFVASYTTDHIILNNTGAWKRPSNATFGTLFPGLTTDIMPGINLTSIGPAYGGNFGQDPGYVPNGPYNANPTFTFRDNVSKIVGKHNLQFGAYVVAARKNELGGELSQGSIPGYLTFDATLNPNTTGNPFADLLLGNIYSFGQQDKRIKYYNRYKIVEPYFQDDWHITSRLTLNLGLRLSLFGTYFENLRQAFNFDPAHYNPALGTSIDPATGEVLNFTPNGGQPSVSNLPNGMVQCGVTPGVPRSCMQGHLFNPAPRIGFAFDPKGDGKTAIRGGYGVFFEHANGNEGNTESLENSPPLATTEQQISSSGSFINGYTGIGVGANPNTQPIFPYGVVSIPNKILWPYMQQWHLDVQHEILRNTVVTASYVGSKGTNLTRILDLNQLQPVAATPFAPGEPLSDSTCGLVDSFGVPTQATTGLGVPISYGGSGIMSPAVNYGVANCGTNADLFRKYRGYTSITRIENRASSIYHAFEFSARRQMGGLQLALAYTYSHSIDDSSSRLDGTLLNSYDPASNRASSNFDQRHVLNFSYVWDLPFFKNPGLTNKVLGGWQYSGILGFSTGSPFTVTYAGDNAGVGNGVAAFTAYANQVSDPNANIPSAPGVLQLYNPNAYAAPTGLTFGNAGRNSLLNPNRTNIDMSIYKRFAITERAGFEFRVEAFNVFNHTQFGYVNGDGGSAAYNSGNLTSYTNDLTGSNFLQVLTAHNPRILQLGLKFLF
ncbi:MAG TPA: carboxypeptidase regulatory-like domain-containing protein [Terriglobales bacterium]